MTEFTELISVTDLKRLVESGQCSIVDCRFNLMQPESGRQEYFDGHIRGAVYAHLDEDLAGPVTAESGRHPLPDIKIFVATLSNWGIGNDTQVVVYDHANGAVAARLWWLLNWLGHKKVAVLDGGFAAWTAASGAVSSLTSTISPAVFVEEPRADMVASTEEIAGAIANDATLNLVDARDAARFEGELEPIDAVAGHIPGALNLPFLNCVNEDGSWRVPDDLERIWGEILSDRPEGPLIAMCGSGVTACHLLISARLTGRPEPRLYVGSWSEWIRDDRRPVASK